MQSCESTSFNSSPSLVRQAVGWATPRRQTAPPPLRSGCRELILYPCDKREHLLTESITAALKPETLLREALKKKKKDPRAAVPARNPAPPVATQSRLLNNKHVGGGGLALMQQHPALVIRNLILIPGAGFVVSQEM